MCLVVLRPTVPTVFTITTVPTARAVCAVSSARAVARFWKNEEENKNHDVNPGLQYRKVMHLNKCGSLVHLK